VLVLKTPHSEGITLSKAQAELFKNKFLKLADTHQVSQEKMKRKRKKEARCNERQNAHCKGYKVSVFFFQLMGLFDWPVKKKKSETLESPRM
jgi:hypothetical protein